MLQLDARLGEIEGFSPLIFVRGHFYEIGIAALLFRVKPRHVEKFQKFRFAHVGKSVLGKKKKKHAQNIRSTVHRTGDLIIVYKLAPGKKPGTRPSMTLLLVPYPQHASR